MAGKFITIEGPDGAGKTTQIKLLESYLIDLGYKVLLTREPGGTQIGEKIRGVLLDPANKAMSYKSEVLLYAAARAQIVDEVIKPALQAGQIVICDRFVDSSYAYQGYGRGIDMEYIKKVNAMVIAEAIPNCTLIFDISPEKGLNRVKSRGASGETKDRIEQEALAFHQRVREGFLTIARSETRYHIINSEKSIDEIHQSVREIVQEILQ